MSAIDLLLSDIAAQGQYLYRAAMLTVLLMIAYLFAREHGRKGVDMVKQLLRQRWLMAFLFYLAFILVSTVFGRQTSDPFAYVFAHFGFRDDAKWNNEIIENVLLFIPYTFFFLQSFRVEHPVRCAAIISGATTLFIECSQLISCLGAFQFSDIMHNLLGGMLGCGIWCLVGRLRMKTRNKEQSPNMGEIHDK